MHAFMPPVLVGAAGFDELGQDPQPHPPGRELREPGQGRGREGDAVVGANAQRQAVLFEQAREDRLGLRDRGGAQTLTGEQVPTEAVGDGERIAVAAVAGLELPLVVRAPHRIRGAHDRRGPAGMAEAAARAVRGDEPVPTQDVADRRAAREGPPRVPPLEECPQLLAAPDGVSMASLQDCGDDLVGGLIRGAMGPARVVVEAGGPEAQVAVDPFVARLAGDAISIAELRDRLGLAQVVGDEPRPLVHG